MASRGVNEVSSIHQSQRDGIRVADLASTPIKGLRIANRSKVMLEEGGMRDDRRFYLIDDRSRMINGKHQGALQEVLADLAEESHLRLAFPDGTEVAAAVETGATLSTTFFSQPRRARLVLGAFSAALSEHAGQSLRLVEAADGSSAVDRGGDGAVTMISRASLAYLAGVAHAATIDARRFRMSIEVEGVGAFEEDHWIGAELGLGEARVSLRGHVGRCIVTSRNPETGEIDMPTLDLLRSFRSQAATTEPLAFGVYGAVLQPGWVSVGDKLEVLSS